MGCCMTGLNDLITVFIEEGIYWGRFLQKTGLQVLYLKKSLHVSPSIR